MRTTFAKHFPIGKPIEYNHGSPSHVYSYQPYTTRRRSYYYKREDVNQNS